MHDLLLITVTRQPSPPALPVHRLQVIFFCFALCYGFFTFFNIAKVYLEAYKTVPKGICKQLVKVMAYLFFVSWLMFPILFLMGPEGFGHLTTYGSTIAHTVADILSKNLWGLFGHHLRYKVRHPPAALPAALWLRAFGSGLTCSIRRSPLSPGCLAHTHGL